MGFQRWKLGWDLDLVLLADGGNNGACEIYEWWELMRIQVRAKKNCRALLGGRDSCASGVGARSAMARRRWGRTGAVDRGDEENRGEEMKRHAQRRCWSFLSSWMSRRPGVVHATRCPVICFSLFFKCHAISDFLLTWQLINSIDIILVGGLGLVLLGTVSTERKKTTTQTTYP